MKRKWWPSGRNTGHPGLVMPLAGFVGDLDLRARRPRPARARSDRCVRPSKRITPSAFHVPSDPRRRVADRLRRSARHVLLLQLAVDHERDGPAVRRPERPGVRVGRAQRPRVQRVERPQPDLPLAVGVAGDEHDLPSVGRDLRASSDSMCRPASGIANRVICRWLGRARRPRDREADGRRARQPHRRPTPGLHGRGASHGDDRRQADPRSALRDPLQFRGDVARRLPPVLGILGQAARDDAIECRRRQRDDLADRPRRRRQDGRHDARRALAVERATVR